MCGSLVKLCLVPLLLLLGAGGAHARPMAGCDRGIACVNITAGNLTFQCRSAGPPPPPPTSLSSPARSDQSRNVLLLHGFPEFSDMYSELMRALAARNYSSVACNQRGYSPGASPPRASDYLYNKLEADAWNVARAHFGAEARFHLIGHDHGALLGWAMAASNTQRRLLSYAALSVPHADAFAAGIYGNDADIEQQIASQYFTMFTDKNSASSHLAFWWLSMGKFAGSEDAANFWTHAQDFQKALWWYNGAQRQGIMAMPPVMSASEILSHGLSHSAIAALREMWGGSPDNGTAQATPIGDVVGLPTLFVCGANDPAILCNRTYSRNTEHFVKNATYSHAVVECGHSLLHCKKESETAKVVQAIVAHLETADAVVGAEAEARAAAATGATGEKATTNDLEDSENLDSMQDDPFLLDHANHSDNCVLDLTAPGGVRCFQVPPVTNSTIRVGCVGDSITAVGHTSSIAHHYPNQLQDILDEKHGEGAFAVTNLGICGATLQKRGRLPWWNTSAYETLVSNRWDVIFVMLGTNDAGAKQGFWPEANHAHCDSATKPEELGACNFARDYRALLDVIRSVGPEDGTPPEIHIMIPPALMRNGAYSMNQTLINTVFPRLIPLIGHANGDTVKSIIDVYTGMGGVPAPAWRHQIPAQGCTLNSSFAPCKWYCDKQSCAPGQCHPNDVGCARLADVVYEAWLRSL